MKLIGYGIGQHVVRTRKRSVVSIEWPGEVEVGSKGGWDFFLRLGLPSFPLPSIRVFV